MTDAPEAGDRLDAALEGWIDAHRVVLDQIRAAPGAELSETDRAEGYRWLTRLASLAQGWFVERSDPRHPVLFQLQDDHRKLLVDNPDVRYLFAVLDDSCTYRLTGTRGEAAYVGLTFGTPIGQGAVGGRTGTLTQVHLDEFDLGPDGEVDLVLAPPGTEFAEPPANLIELVPGTGQLAVRGDVLPPTHRSPGGPALGADRRRAAAGPRARGPGDGTRARRAVPAVRGGHRGEHVGRLGVEHQHVRRHRGRRARRSPGRRGALAQRRRHDLPRRPVGARRRRGAGGDGARTGDRVPLLGAHHHQPVDGELRRPVHDHQPQQRPGRSIGGWELAPGDLAGRSRRGQLARHRRPPGGLHARPVGPGRPPHPTCELVRLADL